MILHRKRAILLAVALCASAALLAQTNDAVMAKLNLTKSFLLKQRLSPGYRDSIRRSIVNYENKLDSHCKEIDLDFDSVEVRDRILALLEVDDKGSPIAGSWKESIPGTVCNEKRRLNVQVDVTSKGLRYTTTFPGDAEGNPELQNDTLRNIEINLQVLGISTKKSCHSEVIDTHLIGAASSAQSDGMMSPWKEAWIIRTCGKLYSIPVSYHPDDKGTAISIGTTDIQAQ